MVDCGDGYCSCGRNKIYPFGDCLPLVRATHTKKKDCEDDDTTGETFVAEERRLQVWRRRVQATVLSERSARNSFYFFFPCFDVRETSREVKMGWWCGETKAVTQKRE